MIVVILMLVVVGSCFLVIAAFAFWSPSLDGTDRGDYTSAMLINHAGAEVAHGH